VLAVVAALLLTPKSSTRHCGLIAAGEQKREDVRASVAVHPRFYAGQLYNEMAPVTYRSGKLNPLLASIPPKTREIDFCFCHASDFRWGDCPSSKPRTINQALRPHCRW